MDLGIRDRVALVGGASSGLGRASADRLAAEGCRLILWARGADALDETARGMRARHGVEVRTIVADAVEPGAAAFVAERAIAAFGRVDILVLNAGGPPMTLPLGTDAAGWARATQLLLLTPVELAQALLPGMRERRWGRVVAILSVGVRQPISELVYSNVGRSALTAWLKTVSRAVAADGVTVNGVLPGRILTPRVESIDRAIAERDGVSIEDVRTRMQASIPAGRYGAPDDLGSLVAYLCSAPAAYQTGTFTAVDGGMLAGLP